MGQQQLILLALAVVIVGGAIVVGIRAFNENAVKSNADAMMQDAVRVANDMQAWKQKPAPFGGQASVATAAQVANPSDFTGVTFILLGYQPGPGGASNYVNLNGSYTLSTATPWLITGTSGQFENIIEVEVCGLSDTNIEGRITQLGGTATNAPDLSCTT